MRRCPEVLALVVALAGCGAQLQGLGAPPEVYVWNGQSHALRIMAAEPVPGIPGATRAAVRIVAPDPSTAAAIYAARCGQPAGEVSHDGGTGEYVVVGPCVEISL